MSFLFSSILFPLLFSSLHFLFFTSFILFILPVLLSLSLFLSSLLACSWSWCPVLFPSRHSLLVVSSLSLSSLLSCFWSFSLLVILSFLSLPCLFPLYFLAMTDNGSVFLYSLLPLPCLLTCLVSVHVFSSLFLLSPFVPPSFNFLQAPHQIVSLFNGSRQVVYGFVDNCTQVRKGCAQLSFRNACYIFVCFLA